MLAKLRRQSQPFANTPDPGGQRLVQTDFGANPGALRMLSYVPEGLEPMAPLVVVLHGCTQTASGYAAAAGWLTLADRFGFVVVAPEQTAQNNANRCFNWFEPGDTRREHGEAASIRAMVAHAIAQHGLDPKRVFITGLSAGGAMTAVMLAAYPDVFAAGAIIAGLPYGIADNVRSAISAMYAGQTRTSAELGDLVRRAGPAGARKPRVSIWHGDADATVKASNAHESEKQWASVHDLPSQPSRTETHGGRTRSLWVSPRTGEVLMESNLIHGMGHGAPLSTRGPDGIGAVAPFMLESGVSSSLEIAAFWAIAPQGAQERRPEPAPRERKAQAHHPAPKANLVDQVMASVAQHVPSDVKDVIARALKAAGLGR